MQDVLRILVNLISLIIEIGLAYFAIRLMRIFRGGTMEKPWFYMTLGVLTLTVSSPLFSLYYLLKLPGYVHLLGAFMSMVGGGIVLVGLRAKYKSWNHPE
jgi:TRAP-type C4-dicarboxylate transport system permease small subunit